MAIEKRVNKDGAPAYRVRIASVHPVTGKRQNITIGTYRTKREAEKAERKALEANDRGALVEPKATTVADLLDAWLTSKAGTVSPNSHKDYEIAVRHHLKPALGTVRAQRLGAVDVQQQYDKWRDDHQTYQALLSRWKTSLATWQALPTGERGPKPARPAEPQGLSPRMIERCHVVLNQTLAQAVRFGILPRNVCADVESPRLNKSKPDVWSPAEAAAFLEVAKTDALAPLWYLLGLEVMRRGEALGLRWADVNWERGAVHISQTVVADKSNKGAAVIQPRTKTDTGARTVKLTRETLAVLTEHRDRQRFQRLAAGDAWQEHDLIVCTSLGTPVNPNNVTRSYNRLVILAGVRRIKVHGLRHTGATLLLRAGVPIKVVSERLGHASVAITMDLYSHVLPDMQDAAAAAMSAILAKTREAG